jgi:peptidoglycan/xylan/chitin deacetylase (PgdA/CDA1 family)
MNIRDFAAAPMLATTALYQAITKSHAAEGAFRILLMHDVPEKNESAFTRLLDEVERTGRFISPEQAAARIGRQTSECPGHPSYLLTFDDGFTSNYKIARSILAERNIKAIFFVCPGLMDLPEETRVSTVPKALFATPPLQPCEDLMSWGQLATLAEDGHVIGAHTMLHTRLAALDPARLTEEVEKSAERIETMIGSCPDWFAYPFGNIESIDEPALSVIGRTFKYCRSGVRGQNTAKTNPLALLADHIDLAATDTWRRLILAGGLDFRYRDARKRLSAMLPQPPDSAAP